MTMTILIARRGETAHPVEPQRVAREGDDTALVTSADGCTEQCVRAILLCRSPAFPDSLVGTAIPLDSVIFPQTLTMNWDARRSVGKLVIP
jgi:hypothetical protein